MAGKLSREIKQRSFFSLEQEAALNILKTAEVLKQCTESFLKDYGLTQTQYNVLRILRGAGSTGLPCSQVADRMVARDPDITKLLDRMEKAGWVSRARDCKDRRVVNAKVTVTALSLIAEIDEPLAVLVRSTLGRLGKQPLTQLIDLLEQTRETFI